MSCTLHYSFPAADLVAQEVLCCASMKFGLNLAQGARQSLLGGIYLLYL